jgi:distribution and morphology protein 34
MSFAFDWGVLSNKDVVQAIRAQLNQSINSDKNGERVGSMHITELNFGKQAPEIEISEVTDLSDSKVKTSFSFSYQGEASLTFYSRVQLNAMYRPRKVGREGRHHMGVYDSDISLTAPIYITLSNFRLEGKVVVAFEKPHLSVSLKNECLKDIVVNSSFDGCAASTAVASTVRKGLMTAVKHLNTKPVRIRI